MFALFRPFHHVLSSTVDANIFGWIIKHAIDLRWMNLQALKVLNDEKEEGQKKSSDGSRERVNYIWEEEEEEEEEHFHSSFMSNISDEMIY